MFQNSPLPSADPTKAQTVKELKHNSPLLACRFDPSGKLLFFAAQDFQIYRWDWSGDTKTPYKGHESWVRSLGFLPMSGQLVTGGYEGRLIWWSLSEPEPHPLRVVEAHQGWIRALAVSPDGSQLATVGNDLLVKLWDSASGSLLSSWTGHESHIYNVAFHPQGGALVTGDLKANFIHWELPSGKVVRKLNAAALHKYDTTFRADIGGPHCMAFSGDGKQLACGGITQVTNAFAGVGNPAVVVFDWESGKEVVTHLSKAGLKGVAWGVALHPQGFTVAATGGPDGGRLLFWKPDQKDEFHEFKLPNTARDLAMHSDGIHLATAHYDGAIRVHRLAAS